MKQASYKPTNSLQRLLRYSKAYWKYLIISWTCAAFFGIFSASPSYLIGYTIDNVFVGGKHTTLILYILGFISLFSIKSLFMYLSTYYMNWVGTKVVNDLRTDLFSRIVRFPISFFQEKTTGSLMSHILNDTYLVQEGTSYVIKNGMRSISEATFLIAVAFIQSWKLALLMFVVGPIIAFSIRKMGNAVRSSSRLAQNEMSKVSSLLQETLTGIREIKAFNGETIEIARFKHGLHNYFTIVMQCIHFEAIAPAFIEMIAMTGIATILYIAALQVIHGTMTPGQLTSFFSAVLLAYQPLKKLIQVYTYLQYALGAADRIFVTMDTQFPEQQHQSHLLTTFTSSIIFDNVSFRYHDDHPVLKNVSFTIKKGERIGIIGRSGAGKSTLCDLLLLFLRPTEGTIFIDDVDITTIDLHSLRNDIGYVGQQSFLFNDTIKANVSYAQHASQQEIEQACTIAHAHEFIKNLPHGYNTLVGENGSNLSGGQKQRLTIARAILKKPSILIFDEATSALDNASEEMVRKALESIPADTTIIVISHRDSFIQTMDHIFNLEKGTLVKVTNHPLEKQGNKELLQNTSPTVYRF